MKSLTGDAAEHGGHLLDVAKERGPVLAEVAKERGTDFLEVARDRGPVLAERARERGTGLIDIAKERGPVFADTARERGTELPIAINLAAANIVDIALPDAVEQTLRRWNVPGEPVSRRGERAPPARPVFGPQPAPDLAEPAEQVKWRKSCAGFC